MKTNFYTKEKVIWRSGDIAPLILNLNNRSRSVISLKLCQVYLRGTLNYNPRIAGVYSLEKNISFSIWESNSDYFVAQIIVPPIPNLKNKVIRRICVIIVL